MQSLENVDVKQTGIKSLILTVGMLAQIVGLGAIGSRPVLAEVQNEAVGFSTNHVFDSSADGEHIDAMTGNMTLAILCSSPKIRPLFRLK